MMRMNCQLNIEDLFVNLKILFLNYFNSIFFICKMWAKVRENVVHMATNDHATLNDNLM